jgi:hypothetical protein
MTIELFPDLFPEWISSPSKITKVEHQTINWNFVVPVLYEFVVHFLNI